MLFREQKKGLPVLFIIIKIAESNLFKTCCHKNNVGKMGKTTEPAPLEGAELIGFETKARFRDYVFQLPNGAEMLAFFDDRSKDKTLKRYTKYDNCLATSDDELKLYYSNKGLMKGSLQLTVDGIKIYNNSKMELSQAAYIPFGVDVIKVEALRAQCVRALELHEEIFGAETDLWLQ